MDRLPERTRKSLAGLPEGAVDPCEVRYGGFRIAARCFFPHFGQKEKERKGVRNRFWGFPRLPSQSSNPAFWPPLFSFLSVNCIFTNELHLASGRGGDRNEKNRPCRRARGQYLDRADTRSANHGEQRSGPVRGVPGRVVSISRHDAPKWPSTNLKRDHMAMLVVAPVVLGGQATSSRRIPSASSHREAGLPEAEFLAMSRCPLAVSPPARKTLRFVVERIHPVCPETAWPMR